MENTTTTIQDIQPLIFTESAAEKVELLKEAGIHIIPNPSEMGSTMKEVINKHL